MSRGSRHGRDMTASPLLEAQVPFATTLLSPVGMNLSAAVELDAVISANVRFKNRHLNTSRLSKRTRSPTHRDADTTAHMDVTAQSVLDSPLRRNGSGLNNKKFYQQLGLRRGDGDELLKDRFGDGGDAKAADPTFASDLAAFDAVLRDVVKLGGELLLRYIGGQSSALQAATGLLQCVQEPVFKLSDVADVIAACLSDVADKLSLECSGARKLASACLAFADGIDVLRVAKAKALHSRFAQLLTLLDDAMHAVPVVIVQASTLSPALATLHEVTSMLEAAYEHALSMWLASLSGVEGLLNQSVLHYQSGKLAVNWLPAFDSLWTEAKFFASQGAHVPAFLAEFCRRREELCALQHKLRHALTQLTSIAARLKAPACSREMLQPVIVAVVSEFTSSCTSVLHWSSLNTLAVVEEYTHRFASLLETVDDVRGILLGDVRRCVDSIASLDIITPPPKPGAVPLDEFVQALSKQAGIAKMVIASAVARAELGTKHAIHAALSCYDAHSKHRRAVCDAAEVYVVDLLCACWR